MNLDRFTNKAQEAITSCRQIISSLGHAEVTPEHMLIAILEQQDGVAVRILERLGVKPEAVIADTKQYLEGQPRASSVSSNKDEILVSSKLISIFGVAEKEAERLKDQYISVE